MKTEDWLQPVLTFLLGGGVVTAITTFFRLKPESDQIVVSSAKDVVIIQRGVIEDLKRDRDTDRSRMDDLESKFNQQLAQAEQARLTAETALAECHKARSLLEEEYKKEKALNLALTQRVEHLEAEVEKLQAQTNGKES